MVMRFVDGRARQFEPLGGLAGALPARLAALTAPWRGATGWICTGIGASAAVAGATADRLRRNGVAAVSLPSGDVPAFAAAVGWPVLLLSQSGRSAELVATARAIPAGRGLALTNATASPLAAAATEAVHLGGLADSRASTVGFTALLLAGHVFADWCAGIAVDRRWEDELGALGDRLHVTAGGPADWAGVDVVADRDWLAGAEYGALMIREVGRIRAEALETRRYLHGPMESAPGGLTVLVGGERLDRVAGQLAAGPAPAPVLRWRLTTDNGRTAALGPLAGQLLVADGLQELAGRVAAHRGIDPDQFVYDQDDTKLGTSFPPAVPPALLSTVDERKSS
jgi:glutamine---fructose-6-phosphate transaminase (isomerizing)